MKSSILKRNQANAVMMLSHISGVVPDQNSSVIAEYQATNKKMTFTDKLRSCESTTRKPKLSKTSDLGSTSSGRGLMPFWNKRCQELTSSLWLPTEIDFADSALNSFNLSSNKMVDRSWFSTKILYRQKKSSQKTCSISYMSSPVECMGSVITKTKLIKLLPTKEQRKVFKYWQDVSRWVFNWTIDYIRTCQNFAPTWMDIKKDATRCLPEWTKACPFQIKGIAIKEACNAFWKAKGRPKFRSFKNSEQSCFIPKSAIKEAGLYPRVSGKGLKYTESIDFNNICDSRLVWRAGKYFLSLPQRHNVSYAENQGRCAAIDPGVRVFASFFSTESCGHIGQGDFSRIQRLCVHLDQLCSRISKTKNRQKKRKLKKAAARMRFKIKCLIEELHHKVALFLVKNFDCILLPTFETKQMTCQFNRKIRNKTVRMLLSFSHYKFKQFLKHKAFEFGKTVVDVSEAYTSKTHPETGEIKNIGSAKHIKTSIGWINRDLVGARNILLRALVDSPHLFKVTVSKY
jgi:putative transposase